MNIEKTLNERAESYGSFSNNAAISQRLKRIAKLDEHNKLTDSQKDALTIIFQKIARILNGDPNHVDSWHDIAGYATLVVKEIQEMPKNNPLK